MTATAHALRGYQAEIMAGIRRSWANGFQRTAVVAGVGAGKTTVIAHVVREYVEANPGRRVVVFAHREELVGQLADRIRGELPGVRVGIVKASKNQTRAPVVVASVQTLSARDCARARMILDVGLVIIDECHRASAETYLSVLKEFGCYDQIRRTLALGVTATLFRADGKNLGDVWQDIAAEVDMERLIAEGWLVRPIGIRVDVADLHLERVRISAGDYAAGDLGRELDASLAPQKTAEAIGMYCAGRQGIVFVPRVESAYVFAEAISDHLAAPVEVLHGKTPAADRALVLKRYRAGETKIIVNVGILVEGTDLPMTGFVCIARPTKSNGFFVQSAGRGVRLYCPANCGIERRGLLAGACPMCKVDAVILDVAGATGRVNLAARVQLFGAAEAERIERDERVPREPGEATESEEPEYRDGDVLVHEVVDLFGVQSARRWLRTYRGVYFLPAKDRLIAVLPSEQSGRYDVVGMARGMAGQAMWVARNLPNLGLARAAAEQNMTAAEKRATSKDIKRRTEPLVADPALFARYALPPGATRGHLEDAVDVQLASQRIDPVVEAMPHVVARMALPSSP